MTLIADEKVFEQIPVKKEVKVVISGIYITAIKSARGGLEKPQKKTGIFQTPFWEKIIILYVYLLMPAAFLFIILFIL